MGRGRGVAAIAPGKAYRRWPRPSLRSILDATFYLLRTGCPWHFLPANFPPWQTVAADSLPRPEP